jgi:hypothetical protein
LPPMPAKDQGKNGNGNSENFRHAVSKP